MKTISSTNFSKSKIKHKGIHTTTSHQTKPSQKYSMS